jgi:trans-feruloyl-CoA hydratase/vanillin synthase
MAAKKMKCVKVEKKGGIAWVWLNRPEKRNAMSPQLHFEMDETLKMLETDPATRVVVIAGAGGYFSAGQDLKEFFRANEKNPAGRSTSTTSPPLRWLKVTALVARLCSYARPTSRLQQTTRCSPYQK